MRTFVNDEQVSERPSAQRQDPARLDKRRDGVSVRRPADSRSPSGGSGVIDFRPLTALLDHLRSRLGARARRGARPRDGFGHRRDRRRARLHHARERKASSNSRSRARGKVTLSGKSFQTSRKFREKYSKTCRERIVADLRDGDLAGQHLGTVALGIRHVLCTPLRVVRYLERLTTEADKPDRCSLSRQPRKRTADVARRPQCIGGRWLVKPLGHRKRACREATEKALERELQLAAEIQRARCPSDAVRSGISMWPRRRCPAGRLAETSSTTSICRTDNSRSRLAMWRARPARGVADGDGAGRLRGTGDVDRLARGADGAHQSHADSPRHSVAVDDGHLRRPSRLTAGSLTAMLDTIRRLSSAQRHPPARDRRFDPGYFRTRPTKRKPFSSRRETRSSSVTV